MRLLVTCVPTVHMHASPCTLLSNTSRPLKASRYVHPRYRRKQIPDCFQWVHPISAVVAIMAPHKHIPCCKGYVYFHLTSFSVTANENSRIVTAFSKTHSAPCQQTLLSVYVLVSVCQKKSATTTLSSHTTDNFAHVAWLHGSWMDGLGSSEMTVHC